MGDLYSVHSPARRQLRWRAAVTSALLSLLFLVVYNSTNWLTALRTDVKTWYFSWELAIPFVPLMILPYMSIDLFFIAAPFLCADMPELRTFARRIAFSIVVAGTFFLLLPLRTGFVPQPVEGWLGDVFNTFRSMDRPHNLFPSLHIALRTLLAFTYARHTRGLVQAASVVWFCLIGFSTVLTHQHQLVDLVGGFMLAGFAFYFFRENNARSAVVPNRPVGCYYGVAAIACLLPAPLLWPWGVFLFWPATALGIVAAAYFGVGPGIYRKTDGCLPLSTRFVLAPVLLGQQLSLLYYRRQCRAWDQVAPGVLIGRKLSNGEATKAVREGVTAVLDLTCEFSEAAAFRAMRYHNLPILDLTAPTPDQLREAVGIITAEAAQGTVYVHCKIGYSRSAAVVGAYLMASEQSGSPEEAIAVMRKARPSLIVRDEISQALRAFASHLLLAAAPPIKHIAPASGREV